MEAEDNETKTGYESTRQAYSGYESTREAYTS